MALREHLRELKSRIIKAAVATLLGTIGGFFLYKPAMSAIQVPMQQILADHPGREVAINYSAVGTSFDLLCQVSVFIGLVLASPVWLYQVWAFIVPAFEGREKIYVFGFSVVSIVLFVTGCWIAWLCMPAAVVTLTMFTPEGGSNFMDAKDYIAFVLRLLVSFGIAFVLPVVLVGMNMLGLVRGRTILKSWRWVVVVVALLAAMTAPGTDVMTMFYLMAPLLFLFFLAIGICMANDRRRDRRMAEQAQHTGRTADQATSTEELQHLGHERGAGAASSR